jgi:hypothetical protein
MKELSLHILDVAMNSVKAGASLVGITLTQDGGKLTVEITDNGCGMSAETVRKLSDPFFTTRTTRKVGMGIPLYQLAAQQTGGSVTICSVQAPAENHGTTVTAVFMTDNIDCAPLGDMVSTVITILQGNPEVDLLYTHRIGEQLIMLDTRQIRELLGGIPLDSFEVLDWIREYLLEQYRNSQ